MTFGLVVEQIPQRVPDRGGLQQVGGDLVQERLERVVVVLVDHRHGDVGVLELPGGADATEAPTEDDHMRRPGVDRVPSPSRRSMLPCRWVLARLSEDGRQNSLVVSSPAVDEIVAAG